VTTPRRQSNVQIGSDEDDTYALLHGEFTYARDVITSLARLRTCPDLRCLRSQSLRRLPIRDANDNHCAYPVIGAWPLQGRTTRGCRRRFAAQLRSTSRFVARRKAARSEDFIVILSVMHFLRVAPQSLRHALGLLLIFFSLNARAAAIMTQTSMEEPPPPYEAYDSHAAAEARLQQDMRAASRIPIVDQVCCFVNAVTTHWLNTEQVPTIVKVDTRERWIDTGSKALSGQFELYDLLGIRSHSGSINIGVRPHPADKDFPAPARLVIESHSGSVNVNMAALAAPERDYFASIESWSGSVGGSLIHGRDTTVLSHSGSINMRFSLSGADNASSTLSTTSESGRSDITVLNPARFAGAKSSIKEMTSTHVTKSGSLSLRYPRDWEGIIEGHTQSAGLTLYGRDVEVIERRQHYVLARKGKGDSRLTFHTASGSASVFFE